jgi:hypothetical protein
MQRMAGFCLNGCGEYLGTKMRVHHVSLSTEMFSSGF